MSSLGGEQECHDEDVRLTRMRGVTMVLRWLFAAVVGSVKTDPVMPEHCE